MSALGLAWRQPGAAHALVAWRGFVTHDGAVVAWPTLMAEHSDFHRTFYTSDEDFAARWRQWDAGGKPDVDPGAPAEAIEALNAWLETAGVGS
jgi:hypothetical protein